MSELKINIFPSREWGEPWVPNSLCIALRIQAKENLFLTATSSPWCSRENSPALLQIRPRYSPCRALHTPILCTTASLCTTETFTITCSAHTNTLRTAHTNMNTSIIHDKDECYIHFPFDLLLVCVTWDFCIGGTFVVLLIFLLHVGPYHLNMMSYICNVHTEPIYEIPRFCFAWFLLQT